ncbi:ABC transporter ATP-binding protein [Phytoactinopolyspora alkaliphila]|uniref:ABC transporter ATP-binding protein n=1 Tax=Phytoactinopolyspora alkaliphila TaxID=1783498 RepID=A0A6N9YS04_9ACTN|nr:ABC transporter ATP-binding protein [Phytoactinopolyspora alkaliphila]NED97821.1 ABC transporter ATP-binding protein [Phytoactinopolyspora alkaliphila]
MTAAEPLLALRDVVTTFRTDMGRVPAVNGVSYSVLPGETVGVVGESGSGKSVTVTSALGLLPHSGTVESGQAVFAGRDLFTLGERELQRIRGREIGLIFQDPMSALNPVMTIGRQISEGLRRHDRRLSRSAARARVVELLAEVGIPNPAARARQYPHEFSGGMRQRAMIAMAMANRPRLLIADEPTTALDVTVQAQILALIAQVQAETGAALIMITHDLGVIAEIADRVVVMYGGRVVETGPIGSVFGKPGHPYTRGLLTSLPRLDRPAAELYAIPGQPPNPMFLPDGCAFRVRCEQSQNRVECWTQPDLTALTPGHASACHFSHELAASEEVSR